MTVEREREFLSERGSEGVESEGEEKEYERGREEEVVGL